MNQQHHEHQHGHEHHHHPPKRRGLHKDWRTWTVVVLMLAAMAVYLLTMDESIRPGGAGPAQGVPAANGPPANAPADAGP